MIFNGLGCLGAIGFCVGVLMIFRYGVELGLKVAVGSWAFGLFSIYWKSHKRESGWQVVQGRCLDRELRKIPISDLGDGGEGWYWRVLCEYEYAGKKHQVTPNVQWMNCLSEAAAQKFINKRIAPNNSCRLQINPLNPLQTKLLAR